MSWLHTLGLNMPSKEYHFKILHQLGAFQAFRGDCRRGLKCSFNICMLLAGLTAHLGALEALAPLTACSIRHQCANAPAGLGGKQRGSQSRATWGCRDRCQAASPCCTPLSWCTIQ